jgi:hypothetical protein
VSFPTKKPTPTARIYDDPWGHHQSNYISWTEAVCTFPHYLSEPSTVTGLAGTDLDTSHRDTYKWIYDGHFELWDSRLITLGVFGDRTWTVHLPPPKGDFDPDSSWKDTDKDAFNFHLKSFLDDLNEEPDETEPDGYYFAYF